MKPIKFKESNVTFAENQKEYLPLPAFRNNDGEVISCWKITFLERIKLLFTGKLWLSCLTFNQPLQPLLPMVNYPFEERKE
jgi:hypothetical protein